MLHFAGFFGVISLLTFMSSPVRAKGPSVSLTNWPADPGNPTVDFYVGTSTDIKDARKDLVFEYDSSNPKYPWTRGSVSDNEVNTPGEGKFRVGLGGGKWADCHLVTNDWAVTARNNLRFEFAISSQLSLSVWLSKDRWVGQSGLWQHESHLRCDDMGDVNEGIRQACSAYRPFCALY